jgi:hypothetical protein
VSYLYIRNKRKAHEKRQKAKCTTEERTATKGIIQTGRNIKGRKERRVMMRGEGRNYSVPVEFQRLHTIK